MRLPTIVVADDHAIVREGLVRLLRDHKFDVVGSVGDGRALLDATKRLRPDVIVTDISMPGLNGLEVLPQLRATNPSCRVVVLTMHNDADLAARAVRAGASAFLLKESAGDELVTAIEHALRGGVSIAPSITMDVMKRMSLAPDPAPELSPRQLEIIRLICQGKRTKEIAVLLELSPRTVETHKYEMMALLGVHSTVELFRYAIEKGLIESSGPTAPAP